VRCGEPDFIGPPPNKYYRLRCCYWDQNYQYTGPTSIPTGRQHKTLELTGLAPQLKRQVWALIKRDAPNLMSGLSDPSIRQMREQFGAGVTVRLDALPEAVLALLNNHGVRQ